MSKWTYPDGTTSTKKPRDGETFQLFKYGRFDSEWMWDGLFEQWKRRSRVILTNGQPVVHISDPNDEILLDEPRQVYDAREPETKCECGAEKVKSSMHSTWCPKSS